VRDDAGAGDIEQRGRAVWFHADRVSIASGPVPA